MNHRLTEESRRLDAEIKRHNADIDHVYWKWQTTTNRYAKQALESQLRDLEQRLDAAKNRRRTIEAQAAR